MLIPTPRELILWDVVEEHFSEAVIHYRQWLLGINSHRFGIDQIREGFEERLEMHIEGLTIGGPDVAERVLFPELEEMTRRDRTTVASLVLLRSADRNQWYDLLDFTILAEKNVHRKAIVEAFALVDEPRFVTVLNEAFSRARTPREKALLLEVYASLHADPGDLLHDCFDTGLIILDIAATTAAGAAGRQDLASRVERFLDSGDRALRQSAVESGLFLGIPKAWTLCREAAKGSDHNAARALSIVGMIGQADDHRIIYEQLDVTTMRRVALWSLGLTGRVESVERSLHYLDDADPIVAKLAVEALGAITGLEPSGREMSTPESSEPDIGDERVTIDDFVDEAGIIPEGTANLPTFDPHAIASSWDKVRSSFKYDQRYLFGASYTPSTLLSALRKAPMRRRHALALELALRTRGEQRVTADAFSTRQLRELAALERFGVRDGVE